MQNSEFRKDLRRLGLSIGAGYLAVLCLSISLLIWTDFGGQVRLAKSYAQAARHLILTRDRPQAVGALQAALGAGFEAVRYVGTDDQVLLELPNTSTAARVQREYFVMRIPVDILTDPSTPQFGRLGTLDFYYPIGRMLLTCLLIAFGSTLGFALYFRHSRKQLTQEYELHVQYKQAEAMQDLSRQVSHDIRSPLSALRMTLAAENLDEDERKKIIESCAKRISDIANDLLQKSRNVEAITHAESYDLVNFVRSVVKEKVLEHSSRDDIQLKVDAPIQGEASTTIDSIELGRVLSNLINNSVEAIEGAGSVVVSLRSYAKKLTVSIQDTGAGIPEHILPELGKRRLTHGKKTGGSGSGLGLMHARNLVESVGGQFGIQSRVGSGTIITLTLPRTQGS